MKIHSKLLKGTFYLTLAGVLSRIIGFFYKIFISNKIGTEAMGIYQLIFPIFALCISLSSAGVQTCISKYTAQFHSVGQYKTMWRYVRLATIGSLLLSLLCMSVLHSSAAFWAEQILKEPRCAPLLKLISYSLPFAAIHSCVCGFYYGINDVSIPAFSQLLEQLARVGGVFLICQICLEKQMDITAQVAAGGILIGEICASLYSLTALSLFSSHKKQNDPYFHQPQQTDLSRKTEQTVRLRTCFLDIFQMAFPLTMNRTCISLLNSLEVTAIPFFLRQFGMSTKEALSVFGILTGMSLPLILFPSALTNSVSILLVPNVATAQANHQQEQIKNTAERTISCCLLLGITSTIFFLLTGRFLGNLFFHSRLAGDFICTLSWLCPFLYLSITINGILHGLGKSMTSFMLNSFGIFLRILFVFFSVPRFGISGYLIGMLISQLSISLLSMMALKKYTSFSFRPWKTLQLLLFQKN